MAAPERFAEMPDFFPCTAGAVHTWHKADFCSRPVECPLSGEERTCPKGVAKSANDLGCVKTPERDARVEAPRPNCASRESNHTAHGQFEAALENCIFYILPMYEFLHSQGQNR
jgi:hypothetical protein